MLVERPLNGTPEGGQSDLNDDHYNTSEDPTLAVEFLKKHVTAKILFIVDTHSLDNGCFVYAGDSPMTYEACSLLEVGPSFHRALPASNFHHRS